MGKLHPSTLRSEIYVEKVKTDNRGILEGSKQIFLNSFFNNPSKNIIINCDEKNQLLIDAGKKGSSLIMEQACKLVNSATKQVKLVSPYIPMSRMRNSLNNATSRGVSVEVISSEVTQLGFAPKLSQFVHNLGQSEPNFTITRCPDTVHAKIVTIDNQSAIIGSHNFDELFVYFGTEEIALFSKEQELIQELNQYIKKLKSRSFYKTYEN